MYIVYTCEKVNVEEVDSMLAQSLNNSEGLIELTFIPVITEFSIKDSYDIIMDENY